MYVDRLKNKLWRIKESIEHANNLKNWKRWWSRQQVWRSRARFMTYEHDSFLQFHQRCLCLIKFQMMSKRNAHWMKIFRTNSSRVTSHVTDNCQMRSENNWKRLSSYKRVPLITSMLFYGAHFCTHGSEQFFKCLLVRLKAQEKHFN